MCDVICELFLIIVFIYYQQSLTLAHKQQIYKKLPLFFAFNKINKLKITLVFHHFLSSADGFKLKK